jgi:halocyanin-like protein
MNGERRRAFLSRAGIAITVGVAGCSGGGGDDGGDGAPTGEDYPAIDEWLTTTEVGDADDTYDGTFVDRRGEDTVRVDVGAEGNGGYFAFGPSALVVSAGTTVEWNWTGQGNPHNVEALPEEQLGESDYEFSSGEAEGGSGVKFSRTLEDPGVVLYHCEPHLPLGMKGGIAVE